ncbi:two pore domain potassium channel family protein [Bremerella cremea]|uniref:Two pore domain potassium channel family protein n=1 Tax=Bremerella cremea TaxID=1031537 RepID=A0A368KUC1_9BACT|nr:two pore domain potassium channel family protein [Bremerella cremea]
MPARSNRLRFSLLLLSLLAAVVVGPLFENDGFGKYLQLSFLTLVFVSSIYTNWNRRIMFWVVGGAAMIGIGLHWGSLFFPNGSVSVAKYVVGFLFLGLTAVILLKSILVEYQAKPDALLGAACVYLLLGFMWALGYSALMFIEDAPFYFPQFDLGRDDHPHLSTFLYFSFVTMSTLGYGDIIPTTPLSRTLAWMQSVTGQFYLAVLVAYLVNMLPNSPRAVAQSPKR